MKYINQTKEKGFTLIETLVAIFILLLSISGPLSSAQSGLRASFFARDQIVAFYLAQDSIETIKYLRDNHALNGFKTSTPVADWLATLGVCNPTGVGDTAECIIGTDKSGNNGVVKIGSCSTIGCEQLYYDARYGRYTYESSGNSVSKYSRKVYVTSIADQKEAQIVVDVSWDSNFIGPKHIIVQENIYNWIKDYLN